LAPLRYAEFLRPTFSFLMKNRNIVLHKLCTECGIILIIVVVCGEQYFCSVMVREQLGNLN